MPTYIALLRAVNLGGYGKLSMAEFRKLLEGLGFGNVQTYIQSGNAVFDAKGSAGKTGAAIAAGLEKLMGARVHVNFLAATAATGGEAALRAIQQKYPERRDRFHVAGEHIYFHFPDGAAETKFTGKALERAIGAAGTGRNWNTVVKLWEMTKGRD